MSEALPCRLATLREIEDQHIRAAFYFAGKNVVKAANLLKIGRTTAYRRIKSLGLLEIEEEGGNEKEEGQ